MTSPRPLATRNLRRRRRAALRWVGRCLVLLGFMLLGSVAYRLWGTGIGTAHAQSHLRTELQTRGYPERPIPGGAVGVIRIPKLELDMAFVQGVAAGDLAKGPGHYPHTPLPGRGGNVAIAGHRTTHLAPFWSLDALHPGDPIELRTRRGTFVYRVKWTRVVADDAWWVTQRTDVPSLTLTTCYPRFSSRQRLVVRAVQVSGASSKRDSVAASTASRVNGIG